MKSLLFILLCFVSFSAFSQQPTGAFSQPNASRGIRYNGLMANTELYAPIYDTMFTPLRQGAITRRPQDTLAGNNILYTWIGYKWTAIDIAGSGGGGTTINGTGFVKASGTTISYDNSTYLTQAAADGLYAALVHTHTIANVTGLQAALDAKLAISDTANIRFRPHAGSNISLSGTYPDITIASSAVAAIDTSYATGLKTNRRATDDSAKIVAQIPTNNNTLTNGANYITSSSLTPYLTSATAATTYLPVLGGTITGTGGNGFINFIPQSSNPSAPTTGYKLFATSAGSFAWMTNLGYSREFRVRAQTQSNIYHLYDRSYTVADSADLTAEVTARTSAVALKENALGNPAATGQILSSTTGGVRSWVTPPTGGATYSAGANIQISGVGVISALGAGGLTHTINVTDSPYYAKGDGTYFVGAAITSGSNNLTTTGTTFSTADIGKYIDIGGAGTAGARLVSTIVSVVTTTSITIANNAVTTVSAQEGKYGTDNTLAFQNAIYALKFDSTISGKIVVPYTGKPYFFTHSPYIVDRNSNTVNNAQIYIPASGGLTNSAKVGSVVIEGEITPNFYADYLSRSTGVPLRMVILQSTLDTISTLFGNASTNIGNICGNGNVFANFTFLTLKNLVIRINSKNGTTHTQPIASALRIPNMAMIDLENVVANTESTGFNAVQPDSLTSWGIETMSECNWAVQNLKNVVVNNFGNGLTFSEHAVINNAFISTCYNGLVVQKSIHDMHANRLLIQWCRNNIRINAKSFFTITNLDCENAQAASGAQAWQYNVFDVYEATATNSYGTIGYHVVGGPSANYQNSETNLISLSANVSPTILVKKIGFDVKIVPTSIGVTLFGGTKAGDYISLHGSSNATDDGNIYIGTTSNYDDKNERLGINTQVPVYPLHVKSTLLGVAGFESSNINSTLLNLKNTSSGGHNWQVGTGGSSFGAGDFYFKDSTNNTIVFYAKSNGNVGVGTTGPTSTLHTTSFATAYVAKTANYTLASSDNTVEVTTGTNTQTLPTAVGIAGREYWITNTGSGTVTIATTSSQTFINVTATPTTLSVPQFSNYMLKSNGANWLAYKIVN